MKRIWKRAAALLTMLVLVLSMGITAGATTISTGSGGEVTNTADVKITGVPTGTTVTYTTYQVLYATYNNNNNELTWHLTDWAKAALVADSGKLYTSEADAIKGIIAISTTGSLATEQDNIVNTLAAYVASNSTTADSVSWETDNGTSTATLSVGSYLLIPSATDMSFLNMLVSVSAEGDGSDWTVTGKEAVLKGSKLTIEKKVSETGTDGTYVSTADTEIGSTVYYEIKVYVPKFAANDSEKIFSVQDIATNLKIDPSSVVVKPYTSSDNAGTALIKYNGETGADSNASTAGYALEILTSGSTDTMTITFTDYYDNVFYVSGTKTYPYEYVIISYEAELLSSAATYDSNNNGNSNKATLTYDYDNHTTNTASSNATVYTYALDLTKYGENDQTKLSNASFRIYYYDDQGGQHYLRFIKNTDGSYSVADSTDEVDSTITKYDAVTTLSDGTLTLKGLNDDVNYFIVESVAPSGYSLNTNILNFKITEGTTAGTIATTDGVTSTEYTAYDPAKSIATEVASTSETWGVGSISSTTAKFTLSVTDTKISALPATGSIGIIVFTIAGVAIMILALALINSGKSKQKKA